MEKNEYRIMYDVEDKYWWYVGLHRLILSSIPKWSSTMSTTRILDAGCGTGALLQHLADMPVGMTSGVDIAREALHFCQERKLSSLSQASIHQIPFLDTSFDVVISMDVLCNLSLHDMDAAFREISRVLKPGGVFIFNLPAYNLLKSSHDRAVHLQHRFIKRALRQKLQACHFTVRNLTYRNSILFPALALIRVVNKLKLASPHAVQSDLKPLPSWINRLLTNVLLAENAFLLRGGVFPVGLSLFGVVQKSEPSSTSRE